MTANPVSRANVIDLFRLDGDIQYYRKLLAFGGPIIIQQLLVAGLNLVSVVMIGQKGEVAVAAVGLATQVFFFLNQLLIALGAGSAIFTAQLWGRGDIPNLRKVLGLCLLMSLGLSAIFLILSVIFFKQILNLFSQDPQVILLGGNYLRIFAWSFLFAAITYVYSTILRSTGHVRLPMYVSTAALAFNTLLTYALVFGRLGLPELGVEGAAVAILVSRVIESALLLFLTYRLKLPAAASLKELLSTNFRFVRAVLDPVLPVAVNEVFWSVGILSYSAIYARIGTGAITAVNIVTTLDSIAAAILLGIATAASIIVGHQIGAGDEIHAQRTAGRTLTLGTLTGAVLGALILIIARPYIHLYNISSEVVRETQILLTIYAVVLWIRGWNGVMVVGVLRGGGDTRFCLFLDGIIILAVGVPLAYVAAFILGLPVYWVYVFTLAEDILKALVALPRYISRRWIHNLTHSVS